MTIDGEVARIQRLAEIMAVHGRGCIERSVPVGFTASETFDVGMDLGSPGALDYHDRAPFAFNGEIEKIHIKFTYTKEPEIPVLPEDD